MLDKLTHLKQLEAESIHIIREVAAEFDNPVMLYSIGKDSAVMLHLARKAFFPGKLPFPVLHVDTRWKFQEMYRFREKMVSEYGLAVHPHQPHALWQILIIQSEIRMHQEDKPAQRCLPNSF